MHLALEHAKAATFCFRYLTSEPFRTTEESVLLHARRGCYGFQDYAVQHCLDHFERRTGLENHDDVLHQTFESARGFLATYSLPVPKNLAELSHHDIASFFGQLPTDKRERADRLTIGFRTLDIRTAIENIRLQDLSPEETEATSNLYGLRANYKCPKIWCDDFSTGFDKDADRRKHVQCHDRHFRCPEASCWAFEFGFPNQIKVEEHIRKHHHPQDEEALFPKAVRQRLSDTLFRATARGDLVAMLAFLDSGVEATEGDLFQSLKDGNIEACKLLIESLGGVHYSLSRQYDSGPQASMNIAITNNQTGVIPLFLSWLSARQGIAGTALSGWIGTACKSGHLEAVQVLMESSYFEARGKENYRQAWGAPSWIETASSRRGPEYIDIVRYLLEQGFSDCVTPDALANAHRMKLDDMINLLEPIFDLRGAK